MPTHAPGMVDSVGEGMVDSAVDAITTAARTGEIGDGRVWVIPVERTTNIRTGETETA